MLYINQWIQNVFVSPHSPDRYVISNRAYSRCTFAHSYPTFNSPRLAIASPQLRNISVIFLRKSKSIHRRSCSLVLLHIAARCVGGYTPFTRGDPTSYPRTSVRVSFATLWHVLSNEWWSPPVRFRAGPCSTFFPKVARRAPPYTALIKTRRRNFPRERVSLMRRSRNTNASRLSFIKKETREPRDRRVAHLA